MRLAAAVGLLVAFLVQAAPAAPPAGAVIVGYGSWPLPRLGSSGFEITVAVEQARLHELDQRIQLIGVKLHRRSGEQQEAGNEILQPEYEYHRWNCDGGIEDPAQAWNAVTVGAFTEKVFIRHDDFRGWQQNECAHLVAGTRQRDLIEICERNDQVDALLLDELAQSRDVSIVLDSRHERMQVGVVESGSERIDVRGNRDRTGLTERLDDVDALSRTREENRRHGVQYSRNGKLASAEAARTAAAAIRHRPGRRSTA